MGVWAAGDKPAVMDRHRLGCLLGAMSMACADHQLTRMIATGSGTQLRPYLRRLAPLFNVQPLQIARASIA
jgi:hypothetical protein